MLVGLPDFTRMFAETNNLDIVRWHFDPGMCHGDTIAWWRQKSVRRYVHHGLDFVRYESSDGTIREIQAGMHVPLPGKGTITSIIEDFLWQTVISIHGELRRRLLVGLYGHVRPVEGILDRNLEAGSIIAELSHSGKSAVPAHLHMGLALLPKAKAFGTLSWDYLNTSSEVEHIDPLELML